MQLWFYNESHACFSTELFIIWVPETVRFFTGDFFFCQRFDLFIEREVSYSRI